MKKLSLAALLLTAGCVVYQEPPTYVPPQRLGVEAPPPPAYLPPPPDYQPPPQAPVVSVYVEPPLEEPEPIAVPWAPPPMLVELPPPPPYPDSVWIGGFWVWQGTWIWDHGRWAEPPHHCRWVQPYYEHRNGVVIFITGHWATIGVAFVPPRRDRDYEIERPRHDAAPGHRPIGPEGVFVPAPPGSRAGLVIPAPVGTAPAVVTSAPAVVNVGMRVNNINSNNTTVVTNVTNVTNVTIVAPSSATASGRAVETTVPAQAHLAAALPAPVQVSAPEPVSPRALPSFQRGRGPVELPPAQAVQAQIRAEPRQMTPPQRPSPPQSSPILPVVPAEAPPPAAPSYVPLPATPPAQPRMAPQAPAYVPPAAPQPPVYTPPAPPAPPAPLTSPDARMPTERRPPAPVPAPATPAPPATAAPAAPTAPSPPTGTKQIPERFADPAHRGMVPVPPAPATTPAATAPTPAAAAPTPAPTAPKPAADKQPPAASVQKGVPPVDPRGVKAAAEKAAAAKAAAAKAAAEKAQDIERDKERQLQR
jgi:hypothetical protein